MTTLIDRIVTSGTFSLDGDDFDVDNNVWLVGDRDEVVVVDAAHDHRPILDGIGGRHVVAIVCTHAHNDHINAAAELSDASGAPVLLHPDDTMLWDTVYPDRRMDGSLADRQRIEVGDIAVEVRHTPGHSPGGVCLWLPSDRVVLSGDTLFRGGPGATGRSFSDRDELVESIRRQLLTLPDETTVHPGHGDSTTVGAERATLS